MASEVNFTLDQGSTFSLSCVYKDSEGNPINLTEYTARSQARETVDASTTLWNLVSPNDITLGGSSGEITLTIPATTTANYPAGKTYFYDLELITGSTVIRLIQGQIYISPEVTR